MAVSLSVETLNWHCPPWGGLVHGPSYDRQAVTPGIVHIGLTEFHRAHQAHFIDEFLSSGQVDCLSWGISGVSFAEDQHLHHAMEEQSGMYVLCTRNAQEPMARIIGAYCEHLSAPGHHAAILDRLQADSTKIISICLRKSDSLDDAGALDGSSEDIQSDLGALRSILACTDAESLSSTVPLKTAAAYLVAAAALRKKRDAPPVAVLSCDAVPRNGERCASAVASLAQQTGGDELMQYIQEKWRFPSSVCDRIVYRLTPTVLQDLHRASGVADKGPVACEDFVRWVVEEQEQEHNSRSNSKGKSRLQSLRRVMAERVVGLVGTPVSGELTDMERCGEELCPTSGSYDCTSGGLESLGKLLRMPWFAGGQRFRFRNIDPADAKSLRKAT
ncbi:Mannitol 2-dehydrogenase [Symbiodinium microadriaticum]|uniref:mannitol 2-dehydrogenase n=1 Tax=Symbiodinium microadriaticum TaxID=2951 RepID=A0A1Q9DVR9_SYMMI|nr:Mannitol 2-dehydrogenase [Symbiodinium microadriaticum]